MSDFILVVPPLLHHSMPTKSAAFVPALGVGYLAAVLECAGYEVALLDMEAERLRGSHLAEFVRTHQPRVVGITTTARTYKNALRAAQIIKDAYPSTKVIVGGPQATFLPEETLACQAVDIVVRFEGEETILELMHHFDGDGSHLHQIRGIAFRDGKHICQTERRPLIADLDSIPRPARHLFKMDRYETPGALITARGCPSKCVFCAANALYSEPTYRSRSPEAVVGEIEELSTVFKLRSFFIADDTFTIQPQRAISICDLLIERNFNMTWWCDARINTMSPQLAKKLKQAGCKGVQFGIETGNAEVMKLIRKGISLDQIEEVVHYSLDAGLDVMCAFIIGFPWDTPQTISQTLQFAKRLKSMGTNISPGISTKKRSQRGRVSLGFAPLSPLPGTYIYDNAEKLGIRFLSRDWDRYTFAEPLIETNQLTATEIRKFYFDALQIASQ